MDDIKIELNQDLEGKLHSFSEVKAHSLKIAEAIAERARELAPVDSGQYRDGIVVNKPNEKGVARVVATDQKSAWVEFGNRDGSQPAQFVMRSAVESLGLKWKKGK